MNNNSVSRRKVLEAIGLFSLFAVLNGKAHLENITMDEAPEMPGKILLDAHNHIGKRYLQPRKLEELLHVITSGIVGISYCSNKNNALSYDDVLRLRHHPGVSVEEINAGLLCQVAYKGRTGYAMKSQEIMAEDFHILSLGLSRNLADRPVAADAINEIKDAGGMAIIAHPMVHIDLKHPLSIRPINEYELATLEQLSEIADEIEAFNAQNINLIPGRMWFNQLNEQSRIFCRQSGFNGFAVSDAHDRIEQVKRSGVYLEQLGEPTMKYIHVSIKVGLFEPLERYISNLSAVKAFLGL